MAVTRKYTQSIPVQLTEHWRDRVTAVCDAANVSKAEIIRTCIEAILPTMELSLGIASEEVKAALMASIAQDGELTWVAPDTEVGPVDGEGPLDLDALTKEPVEPRQKSLGQLHQEAVDRAKLAGDRAAGSFGWDPTPWMAQPLPADGPGV
jgi:hypothetical protein